MPKIRKNYWSISEKNAELTDGQTERPTDPLHRTGSNKRSDNTTRYIKRKFQLKLFSYCKLPTNCLSVFGHFVKLALKGLKSTLYFIWKIQVDYLLLKFVYAGSRACKHAQIVRHFDIRSSRKNIYLNNTFMKNLTWYNYWKT